MKIGKRDAVDRADASVRSLLGESRGLIGGMGFHMNLFDGGVGMKRFPDGARATLASTRNPPFALS